MKYLTKSELYKAVDGLIQELDISLDDYPLDSVYLARKFFLDAQITYLDFDNFCAILYRGKKTTTLALNSKRTKSMHNFDCMHEIIHYFLHEDVNTFHCLGLENSFSINNTLEWQANEGAAQALLPYQLFIPMYLLLCKENEAGAIHELARYFDVTEKVIENRIDNLSYEIYQYKVLNKDISQLEILSRSNCEKRKLSGYSGKDTYCSSCHSLVKKGAAFCSICGASLDGKLSSSHGFGSIKYDKIELSSDHRASFCPVCSRNDFDRSGYYCSFCGAPIVNRCTNHTTKDVHGLNLEWQCDSFLDGDARFCSTCGSKSIFFKEGFLTEYKK